MFIKKGLLTTLAVVLFCFSTSAFSSIPVPDTAYKTYTISEKSDEGLHSLVAEAAQLVYPEPEKARKLLIQAIGQLNGGKAIDNYDYLWINYGLLKTSFDTGSSDFSIGTEEDYIKVAKHVLKYLDAKGNTGEWQFTEVGQFQMEVYREAGNGLAWQMYENSNDPSQLNQALAIVDKTLEYVRGSEDYYIFDTKVRILLKLKRNEAAYAIVKKVLSDDPSFGDFQDFTTNEAYQNWANAN